MYIIHYRAFSSVLIAENRAKTPFYSRLYSQNGDNSKCNVTHAAALDK